MRLFVAAVALATAPGVAAAITPADVDRIMDVKPGGPGCAVAIVENGRIAFSRAYGLADLGTRRPVTAATTFNIASMTKQFTGMAIALLIADGKLREDDDVRTYLPELRDYGHPIRIANLLNHSSGLRNHMALAAFQPGDHLPSHEEALALVFRQSALNFAPGTRHQYESPNYVLLAEIVSRVSGKPYEAFLRERIFQPLAMTATGLSSPALARAYAPNKEGGWRLQEKVNRAKGSSGLLSNVEDFARWMINYDRLAVGGAAARERMFSTSKLADNSLVTYRYGLEKEFDYGGVQGLTRISHGGQTAAYRSAFSYFPGRGSGDVVMCNFATDAQGRDQAIVDAMIQPKQAEAAVAPARAIPPGRAAELAGTYYSHDDDDVREFVAKDGALALRVYGEDVPLTYVGGFRFTIPGQGEFRFIDPRARPAPAVDQVFSGQARLRFHPLADVASQDAAEFAGLYRSDDVDGPVTIAVKDGRLHLTYAAGAATLRQIGRDHFASPEEDFNSVWFQRSPDGKVAGLTLSVSSGITRLRFRRAAG